MIKYDLICKKAHEFEGWFSNSGDYDDQKDKRLLVCPTCGTDKVEKAIMAPAVSTSNKNALALRDMADKIRTSIAQTCDDVGDKFADEARAIHYGEKPKRGIYGSASPREAADLIKEGVEIAPLPDAIAPKPNKKLN